MPARETMGARGGAETSGAALAFAVSLDADAVMAAEDIWGSEAHAIMLARQGIIGGSELREMLRCLEQARAAIEAGELELRPELEDIHMNVEAYVRDGAGPDVAGRLHTARSRNDQVVTDCRLHLRCRILDVQEGLADLQEALLDLAEAQAETVMPGYTHTQHAQPITVGFWASGHGSALARDQKRLAAAYETTNTCPLGSCALAGTSFPIDRQLTAELLGFDAVLEHALDAVGTRDFAAEALSALAILMSNVSKLAEELVLWTTYEFGGLELADEHAFGSSIMPQKKNPCIAELTRAKTAGVFGALMNELALIKGTPSGYNRDLQEDKPPLWRGADDASRTVEVLALVIRSLKVNVDRLRELSGANFAAATELANYLVRELGLPFRESHGIVGGAVQQLADEGKTFDDLPRVQQLLAAAGHPVSEDQLGDVLDPERCVHRMTSPGGTAPARVRDMIGRLRSDMTGTRDVVGARRQRCAGARQRTAEIVDAVL
ncbi:MAG: argininosuccinate lyase, partial [Armatimonadota bacterium]